MAVTLAEIDFAGSIASTVPGTSMLKVLVLLTGPEKVFPLTVSVTMSPGFTSPVTVPLIGTVPLDSLALRILSAVTGSIVIVAVTSLVATLDC